MGLAEDAIREARMKRVEKFIPVIAERYGVTHDEILSRRRTAIVAQARHALWVQLWQSGIPLIEIGRLLGYDHTSVMNGVRKTLGDHAYRVEAAERAARPKSDLHDVIDEIRTRFRVAS